MKLGVVARARRWLALPVLLAATVGAIPGYSQVPPNKAAAQVPGMPPLRGLTVDSAVRVLRNKRLLRPQVTRRASPDPAGIVIDQAPEAGQPVSQTTPITLTVSSGPPPLPSPPPREDFGQPVPTKADSIRAPNLIGDTREVLAVRVVLGKFQVEEAGTVSDDAHAGQVVRQDPEPGAPMLRSTPVRVWFARGTPRPVLVPVPDLRDSTLEGARLVLRRARLRLGGIERVPDANGTGRIGRQDPSPPDSLPPNSPVSVVVLDPAPVIVPDVVRMEIGAAIATLRRAGLVASPVDSAESDSAAHTVLFQRPESGTPVARGSNVHLQFAYPSRIVAVPSVEGQAPEAARRVLDSAGLRLGTIGHLPSRDADGLIVRQGPLAGTRVVRGTSVAVWVAEPIPPDTATSIVDSGAGGAGPAIEAPQGPPRIAVPKVTGMPRAQAEGTLRGAGLTVGVVTLVEPRGTLDTVIAQRPAVGDSVGPGTAIALDVAILAAPIVPRLPEVPQRSWPPLWLIVSGSLVAIGAAAASLRNIRQKRRDDDWRRRLGFEPRAGTGSPGIPDTADLLDRPEVRLIPREGTITSRVVGDGPLIKGDSP